MRCTVPRAGRIVLVLALLTGYACNEPRYQGRTVSSWMTDLEAEEDHKRRQACEALAELGPDAAKSIPELIKLLEDVNEGVQEFAAVALGKMGPQAVVPLEEILESDVPAMRMHAASALVAINPQHAGAGSVLAEAVVGIGNADLAKTAKKLVLKMEERAVPLLLPKIEDPYAPVREQVVATLGALKEHGNAAVPALEKRAREDSELKIRVAAVTALAAVGKREQVEPIFRSLLTDDEGDEVATTAGAMLQYIGARDSATGMEGAEEADTEGLSRTVTENAKLSAENMEPDPTVEETGVVQKKSKKKAKRGKKKRRADGLIVR